MCAINPKRQQHFRLGVYTSLEMTDDQWNDLLAAKLNDLEQQLNADMRLRWHIAVDNL